MVAWCGSLSHQLGVVGYLGFDGTFQKRRNLRRERGSEPTGAVGLDGRQLRVGPAHACMGVTASKTLMHKKSRILPMCVLQKTSKSKQPASRRIGWSRHELEFLNHSTQARRQVPSPFTRGRWCAMRTLIFLNPRAPRGITLEQHLMVRCSRPMVSVAALARHHKSTQHHEALHGKKETCRSRIPTGRG